MISQCPHCEKTLQLNQPQQDKIRSALANLKSGLLRLGCPHCKKAIHVAKDGSLALQEKAGMQEKTAVPSTNAQGRQSAVIPPPYPDISWLASGFYTEGEVFEDILKVLILMPEGPGRDVVEKAFDDFGYQTEFPESTVDAMAQMRFVTVAAVVLHTEFEDNFETSQFHKYIEELPMDIRRSMYYVLVGKQFSTLYDLEALAHSANVVVNDTEIEHIDIILQKGLQDYAELFGPYIERLHIASS